MAWWPRCCCSNPDVPTVEGCSSCSNINGNQHNPVNKGIAAQYFEVVVPLATNVEDCSYQTCDIPPGTVATWVAGTYIVSGGTSCVWTNNSQCTHSYDCDGVTKDFEVSLTLTANNNVTSVTFSLNLSVIACQNPFSTIYDMVWSKIVTLPADCRSAHNLTGSVAPNDCISLPTTITITPSSGP